MCVQVAKSNPILEYSWGGGKTGKMFFTRRWVFFAAALYFTMSAIASADDASVGGEDQAAPAGPADSNAVVEEAAEAPKECISCHEKTKDLGERPLREAFGKSVHADMDCTDCHQDVEAGPHEKKLAKVSCEDCHDEVAEIFKSHGLLKKGGDDIPGCPDCHGAHDILPVHNQGSRVHPRRLPDTCGRCHEDVDLVKKHKLASAVTIGVYKQSIHGMSSRNTLESAATCNDCHSTGNDAHRILSPRDPESSIAHFNTPATCGKCHQHIESEYWKGIHGQLVANGDRHSPICTDCHGEHGIMSPKDKRSTVNPVRLAEATCTPCHESAKLSEYYGVSPGETRHFVDTYHGLKARAGDLTVANCASCHGTHLILPASDEESSIHPHNLQKTCGECHQGISASASEVPIHGEPKDRITPAADFLRTMYIWLIGIVIGGMIIFVLIDLKHQLGSVFKGKQIQRMTFSEIWQHALLMVSFSTLAITGFALRFGDSFWAKGLFGWEGGAAARGLVHRVAAGVFLFTCVWHVIHLATKRGRGFLKDIMPRFQDVTQAVDMLAYNMNRKDKAPRFGRFSFIEKAEYWALVWGTVVMTISGIIIWNEDKGTVWASRPVLDIMHILHYYEAWLAVLAILVWHLYFSVFRPGVYPMNPSWYSGSMPKQMYEHEHPDDPALLEAENGDDKRAPPPSDS